MKLKRSSLNAIKRVGLDYDRLVNTPGEFTAHNWITGEEIKTTCLVKTLIQWVYYANLAYERGEMPATIQDFDRVRYTILDLDERAYMACID